MITFIAVLLGVLLVLCVIVAPVLTFATVRELLAEMRELRRELVAEPRLEQSQAARVQAELALRQTREQVAVPPVPTNTIRAYWNVAP